MMGVRRRKKPLGSGKKNSLSLKHKLPWRGITLNEHKVPYYIPKASSKGIFTQKALGHGF